MYPNTLQKSVVDYISDDESERSVLLVEAPPGTGKTYTAIMASISFLDRRKELKTNKKVLILTFSKNAKAQLDKQLLDIDVDSKFSDMIEISNFHSFFQKYVWAYSSYLGLGNNLIIVSPNERIRLIKEKLTFIEWNKLGPKQEIKLIEWIGDILEHSESLDCYSGEGIIKRYVKYKSLIKDSIIDMNREGYIAFSDIAYYMNTLLDKSKALLKVIHNKYPLIILDEYQDSSELQDIIIKKLIGENNKALFFADSKQMIYGWRGASESRLENLRVFFGDNIEIKKLEENMRFKDSEQLVSFLGEVRNGNSFPIQNSKELSLNSITVKRKGIYNQDVNLKRVAIYYNILKKLTHDLKNNNIKEISLGILCRDNQLVNYLSNKLREECNIWTKDISNNEEEHNMVGDFNDFIRLVTINNKGEEFSNNYCKYIFKFLFCILYEDSIASIRRSSLEEINVTKLNRATNPILKLVKGIILESLEKETYYQGLKGCLKIVNQSQLKVNKDLYTLLMDMLSLRTINYENTTKVFLQYQHRRAYKLLKGIYILTMHQSKGREFDIVYVINEPKMDINDNVFYVSVTRTKMNLSMFQIQED